MCIELGYNSSYNQEELAKFIAEQKRQHPFPVITGSNAYSDELNYDNDCENIMCDENGHMINVRSSTL